MQKRLFYILSVVLMALLLPLAVFAAPGLKDVRFTLDDENRLIVAGTPVGVGNKDLTARVRFDVRELELECYNREGELEPDHTRTLNETISFTYEEIIVKDAEILVVGDLNSFGPDSPLVPYCPNDNWTPRALPNWNGAGVKVAIIDTGIVVYELSATCTTGLTDFTCITDDK